MASEADGRGERVATELDNVRPGMASRLTDIIVDCADMDRQAEFWCAALGYERASSDRTQGEEVARLESLGATRADIGQAETAWIVMADPEGNEFCVMPDLEPGDG
jgi:Glyoxalase-like domain